MFNFNLSYSAYSVFKASPLQFYFQYIEKEPVSDVNQLDYGTAGNVVHDAMENYIEGKGNTFEECWNRANGDNFSGFGRRKLDKQNYKRMFDFGMKHIDDLKILICKLTPELKLQDEFYNITVKGFIDLHIAHDDGNVIIQDWKTNSKDDHGMHKGQRIFYSWLLWKIHGDIPECEWVYFKSGNSHKDTFDEDDLVGFDNEIREFLRNIKSWGWDKSKFEAGDWKSPFNEHYTKCRQEVERRQAEEFLNIHMSIKGNFVFFEGDVPEILEDGIDFKTKFDLKDKFYMQEAVKKKARGIVKIDDIGTVHLYNRAHKCFPIGLLDKITVICHEYAEFYNKKMKIFLYDKRDKSVLNYTTQSMPEKLITDKILRPYQQEAVDVFLEKQSGIINIATGGGKTFVATEIIRRCKAKTLWIIDRKELLEQTKDVLEELLGVEVGIISGGKFKPKDVTIATIQSINSLLQHFANKQQIQDYLYSVNFVCVDEFHKSAAETYQKVFAKLPNTKYRLGLTATAMRDDGKDPILFSILSDVLYTTSTEDLINMGFLVRPTIIFHKLPGFDIFKSTYAEDYEKNIVEYKHRNELLRDIVLANPGKKTLILTKMVDHGKVLEKLCSDSAHIHGRLGGLKRAQIMEDFRQGKIKTLIMTLSIGAEGLDIPDLDIVVNASANKGDVKSIQVLGRVLRTFTDKSKALYIDFLDIGQHTRKHSDARIKIFKKQGHNVMVV